MATFEYSYSVSSNRSYCFFETCIATNTASAARIMTWLFKCRRGNGYPATLDSAIFKLSVQGKFIKQGNKKIIKTKFSTDE